MNHGIIFQALLLTGLTSCYYNPFNFAIEQTKDTTTLRQYGSKIIWDRKETDASYQIIDTTAEKIIKTITGKNSIGLEDLKDIAKIKVKAIAISRTVADKGVNDWETNELELTPFEESTKTMHVDGKTGEISYDYPTTAPKSFGDTIYVPYNVERLELNDLVGYYRVSIGSRSKALTISFTNVTMYGIEQFPNHPNVVIDDAIESHLTTMNYEGKNIDIPFYFELHGNNYLGSPVYDLEKDFHGMHTVKLPNVVFYSGDGTMTIRGGEYQTNNSDKTDPSSSLAGYAIKANTIVSFLEPSHIVLIGGKGQRAALARGTCGQIPINTDCNVFTSTPKSITIKAGDGGDAIPGERGTFTVGGNAYSYRYLIKHFYPSMATCFNNCFGNPLPALPLESNYNFMYDPSILIDTDDPYLTLDDVSITSRNGTWINTEYPDTMEGEDALWYTYYNFSNHRYTFINRKRTFLLAKQIAESHGGHLLTVDNEKENLIYSYICDKEGLGRPNCWIGLTPKSTYTFRWITDEPFMFANWVLGLPEHYYDINPDVSSDIDIKTHYTSQGGWYNSNSENEYPFIIEWDYQWQTYP